MCFWEVAWLTCMQNVGAWRMPTGCSIRFCHLEHDDIWTWNMGKGRRHWNYINKCNRNVCSQTGRPLNTCASVLALEEGRCAHEQIIEIGWDSDVIVGISLIQMYAKCGSLEDARGFNKMPSCDVVTWNVHWYLAMWNVGSSKRHWTILTMQQEGVQWGPITFVWVLNACVSLVAFEEGRCAGKTV